PNIIIHQPKELLDSMDAWCTKHHGQSGLTAQVLGSKTSLKDAEEQVLAFIKQHIPEPREGILAGNSVHVDRQFLCQDMPRIVEHLHYRIIDVSTIKELAKRWSSDILSQMPPKRATHRALDDIIESIQELEFYKKHLFNESNSM
ncbi:Oligoribonuclease, mitochondrial, partial [Kappamyces sp. JEL0680]